MSNDPNYRALSAPSDKQREEYTWVERRAELYDLVEQAGHYRNLERSTRELGDRYGVSHTQIRKDLETIREWKRDHLGANAEADLETLYNHAVEELLDRGEVEDAYYLAKEHYEILQDMGEKERAPEKREVEHSGEVSWFERVERAAAALEDGDDDANGHDDEAAIDADTSSNGGGR